MSYLYGALAFLVLLAVAVVVGLVLGWALIRSGDPS